MNHWNLHSGSVSRFIVLLQVLSVHKTEAGRCKLCSFLAWSFHTGVLSDRSRAPTRLAYLLRPYESSQLKRVVSLQLPASVFDGLRQRTNSPPGRSSSYQIRTRSESALHI